MLTVEWENITLKEFLNEPQEPAGSRVVRVSDAAAAERGLELGFRANDLGPQPPKLPVTIVLVAATTTNIGRFRNPCTQELQQMKLVVRIDQRVGQVGLCVTSLRRIRGRGLILMDASCFHGRHHKERHGGGDGDVAEQASSYTFPEPSLCLGIHMET